MLRRYLASMVVSLLVLLAFQVPAHADPVYDFSISGTVTANTVNLPNIITWHMTIDSIGDAMGEFGAQEGTITFTTPNSISATLSGDCDVSGHNVTCYWSVTDTSSQDFEVLGFVSLTAIGSISVIPTITVDSSRTDSNSSNNAITLSCTAVTSILVVC